MGQDTNTFHHLNRITLFTALLVSRNIFQYLSIYRTTHIIVALTLCEYLGVESSLPSGCKHAHNKYTHPLITRSPHRKGPKQAFTYSDNNYMTYNYTICLKISLVCTGLIVSTIRASVCSCCTPQTMSCVMINFDGRTDSPVSLSRPSECSYDTVHQYATGNKQM